MTSQSETLTADAVSVVATLLVGAEGVAETLEAPWLRPATEAERLGFEVANFMNHRRYVDCCVDHNSRPYSPMTILSNAPAFVQEKTKRCIRVLRLTE